MLFTIRDILSWFFTFHLTRKAADGAALVISLKKRLRCLPLDKILDGYHFVEKMRGLILSERKPQSCQLPIAPPFLTACMV